tara:strand:+ start:145 stop:621 length:477 start_codon:yes stop_codon:yes gene_type:complete
MTQRVYLNDLLLTPEIRFKKTHSDAVLPESNDPNTTMGDSGYDLTAVEDMRINENSSSVVPVGLTLAFVEPGFWFRIEPRSGLGFKHSLQPHLGVIDNEYRGDLGVKLYNFSNDCYEVKKGDRIAQLVVYRLFKPIMNWADEVQETDRGSKGFGSSGK